MDLVAACTYADDQQVGTRQRRVLALLAKGAGKVGKIAPERVDWDDYCDCRVVWRACKHREQAIKVAFHAELVLQEPDREEQAKVARGPRIVPGEAAYGGDPPPGDLEEMCIRDRYRVTQWHEGERRFS